MRKEEFFEVLGNLDDELVKGAEVPMKKSIHRKVWRTAAACLAVLAVVGGLLLRSNSGMVVKAYARETDEEITAAGAVISTGTISDSGEMKGHPLMFYLSGEDIETVRFSCKNQRLSFMDWTETRDE